MSRRRVLLLVTISLLIALTSMLLRQLLTTPTAISKFKMTDPHQKAVIIVGSGLAGLTAASTLISHQIPVHLLERSPKPGGNSIKASSGINGAPTKYQPGPPFSDTFFYSDTIKSAGSVYQSSFKKERESLIGVLTNKSAEAIEWLTESKGVDLSVVAQLGGHSFPRTHRGGGKTPPGAALVSTLLKSLKESELFTLDTSCTVTKVLKPSAKVIGVEYVCAEAPDTIRIALGPVICTTGGFGGDSHGMLAKYRPDLAGYPSTNDPRPGSQSLLTEVGARVVDMEQVQVHPTSFVDPKDQANPVKFLAAELLRGEGGILMSGGKRFVNEMNTRKIVTAAITSLPPQNLEVENGPKQWDVQLLLDEGVYKNASSHIDFYLWKGLMRKTTLGELGAETMETVRLYAEAAEGKRDDRFGRESFGHWELRSGDLGEESTVYVGVVTPAVHFTMGGVLISPKGEVFGEEDKPIEGLWAAGEVTGGVHGENRLGGSSLLECVVFGRIVGEEAAKVWKVRVGEE